MTVPPEIKRLRNEAAATVVALSLAEQAVRDAEARVRDHYHTTGRALREIGDVLRNSTLTDSQKVSTIAAVMANGSLDDAPGGPCEDAAFAEGVAAERARILALLDEPRAYRLALAEYAARREQGHDRFEAMRLAVAAVRALVGGDA